MTLLPVACHVHSCWSYDGVWSLPTIAAEFGRRGYRIIMTSEHDRGFSESRRLLHREACAEASGEKVLLLPGVEYSDANNIVHVLVWGAVPFLGEGMPTAELLKAVKASHGVAVLAHPSRRNAWKLYDPRWAKDLNGIELWNRKTDGWAPSRNAPSLLKNSGVTPFVGMDFHDRRQLFPLAMRLDIRTALSEQSVLDCLRTRRCYATAFGAPVGGHFLAGASLALNAAEFSRRTTARIYRSLTTLRMSRRLTSR